MDDLALLKAYAESGSDEAFRTLAARHVATVYSAARRQVGEPLAGDVTQAVFILLARKAGKFNSKTILTAWLLTTTRWVCRATLRKEFRRRHYEQEAAHMPQNYDQLEIESAWERVAPLLDDAMAALSEKDRGMVALKFFEQKSHADIAAKLGLSEEASKKRLSRAIERLRAFFAKRGITLGAVTLLGAVSQYAVQAAPAGLVPQVTIAASGAGAGATVAALVKTTLKLITYAKLKLTCAAAAGVLVVASVPIIATVALPDPPAQVAETKPPPARAAWHVTWNGIYTVKGRAVFIPPPAFDQQESTFTLAVSNDCWAMETVLLQGDVSPIRQVFDGTNLVVLWYYRNNQFPRLPNVKWTDGTVKIDDTEMIDSRPDMSSPTAWIAYASQFYLPPGTNGVLRPFWTIGVDNEREARRSSIVPARWTLLSTNEGLPESIDFYFDAQAWEKYLHRNAALTSTVASSNSAVLGETYRSFGRTNVDGHVFPLGGVYTAYNSEHELQTGLRTLLHRVVVTNVTVSATVEPRLFDTVFPGIALVEDYRGYKPGPLILIGGIQGHEGPGPLEYYITNSSPFRTDSTPIRYP